MSKKSNFAPVKKFIFALAEYYGLYISTFLRLLFDKSFVRKEIAFLVLSLVCGAIGSYWWGGWDFMTEQTFTFIAYSLMPLGVLAFLRLIYCLLQTPVSIYQTQENEIEKHSWGKKVEFSLEPYSIANTYGDALVIENKKSIDITTLTVEIIKIEIGREIVDLSKIGVYRLGHIERNSVYKEEKIVEPLVEERIERGRKKEFVITQVVESAINQPLRPHDFLTYPDKIDWPFLPSSEDGSLGAINDAFSRIAEAMDGRTIPPQPRVIIELEIKGEIKSENETITLPKINWDIEVFNDGTLSFCNDEDENEEN